MRTTTNCAAAVLLVAILAQPAATAAQTDTARRSTGDLMHICRSDYPGRRGLCASYVLGFVDGYEAGDALQSGPGVPTAATAICVPETVTGAQLAAVFVRWAERHPEYWHLPRTFGVFGALREAFPCG